MIQYEVVTLSGRTITGLRARAGGDTPAVQETVGTLWDRFLRSGAREQLNAAPGAPCYGLYTRYHLDDESYDAVVGCESDSCPDGFCQVTIPAGEYARFSLRGPVRQVVADAWREIWSLPLPRAYTVDFEEYGPVDENGVGEVCIYLALADICQSCGMPMTQAADHGSESGGLPSRDYCRYCRQDGAFTWDCGMEEMIDFCLRSAPELYQDRERSRALMRGYFPTLRRWQAAGR